MDAEVSHICLLCMLAWVSFSLFSLFLSLPNRNVVPIVFRDREESLDVALSGSCDVNGMWFVWIYSWV